MAIKNNDNSQFGIVQTTGKQVGLINGDGGYPTLDINGSLVVTAASGGTVLTGALQLVKVHPGIFSVLYSGACWLFQAWGSMDPVAAVQNYVHLFDAVASPPAGNPYVAPLPVVAGGGMWSMSFPEGLALSTGLTIGYSQTWQTWLAAATNGSISALIKTS